MAHDERGQPGPAATEDGEARELDPRRWLALVILVGAGFMDMLDVTIVNVAVPSMLRDLNAEYSQIEWVVAGYVIGFAALLVTGGRLGDIFGRKKLFLIGVSGFTLASLLCGTAVNPEMLIGARLFQGAMAGLMVPQVLAIVHVTFPANERGKVLGIWGSTLGFASVAGVIIGGLLVQGDVFGLEWRTIFLINLPIGLTALVAAWFVLRESRSLTAPKLDLVGMVMAVGGILLLIYPLIKGRDHGWPAWIFAMMASSAVVLVLFVAYERRRTRTAGSPLVVLSLFRRQAFTSGMLVYLIFWISLGGFFLVWTLYLQLGLGWTPLHAGLTAAIFAVGGGAGSGLSVEVLTPRFGRKVLMAGALLNAAGFTWYALAAGHYGPGIGTLEMAGPLLVAGFGFGLVIAPIVDVILAGVHQHNAGSASGLLNTTQQVGWALGVALVGVLFFAQLDHDSGRGVDEAAPALRQQLSAAGVPAQNQDQILAGFRTCVQDRSAAADPTVVPASCQPRAGQPAALQQALTEAGVKANAHNFSRTFAVTLWYAIGILIVVFLGMFGLPRKAREGESDDALPAYEPADATGR
ncbi:DHA2 family efflux MFS transporter permease subunit [Actinomadura latina]|uniref:DHA2 family efflux MFS transporter permease subunit n=1 Tax=Actinomadura latina TaxID=163603 RepID=A0A846YVJ6_9ACTN|nr:DHA2 family efflux MFS transporter permease subunit [Actinomadura latina]NKZ03747.1 DHA2 family efflux MFS transporter permease subunit [Actinomadura latina]